MQVLQGDAARAALTRSFSEIPVPDSVLARIEQTFGERLTPGEVVSRILADVRARGDDALRDWTERLDGTRPESLEVSREEIEAATVDPGLHAAIRLAAERVRAFYEQQPAHGFRRFAVPLRRALYLIASLASAIEAAMLVASSPVHFM